MKELLGLKATLHEADTAVSFVSRKPIADGVSKIEVDTVHLDDAQLRFVVSCLTRIYCDRTGDETPIEPTPDDGESHALDHVITATGGKKH